MWDYVDRLPDDGIRYENLSNYQYMVGNRLFNLQDDENDDIALNQRDWGSF